MLGKKVWGILMATAMTVSTVIGGAVVTNAETSDAGEDVTLTFWTPSWREAAEAPIIEDFMKEYPNIKIDVTYMSSDDIKANTKIAASSGTLPDMWYNWGGVLADFYAENGLCLDLTEYAEEHDWDNTYLSGALDLCKYDDQLIGLPQNLVGLVMYYRKDIFQKCGIEVPKTFEELETVCATLKENGVMNLWFKVY